MLPQLITYKLTTHLHECAQRQRCRHRNNMVTTIFYFLATTMVPTLRGLAQTNFNLLGVGLPFAMSCDRGIKHVNGIA